MAKTTGGASGPKKKAASKKGQGHESFVYSRKAPSTYLDGKGRVRMTWWAGTRQHGGLQEYGNRNRWGVEEVSPAVRKKSAGKRGRRGGKQER